MRNETKPEINKSWFLCAMNTDLVPVRWFGGKKTCWLNQAKHMQTHHWWNLMESSFGFVFTLKNAIYSGFQLEGFCKCRCANRKHAFRWESSIHFDLLWNYSIYQLLITGHSRYDTNKNCDPKQNSNRNEDLFDLKRCLITKLDLVRPLTSFRRPIRCIGLLSFLKVHFW